VESFFVGETFAVGLDDGVAALPQGRAQRMECVAAFFHLRSLQVLEGVDGLDLFQIFGEPLDAAPGLAILNVLEEVSDLVLARRAVEDRVAARRPRPRLRQRWKAGGTPIPPRLRFRWRA